jgi:hypothetical protein
MADSIWPTDKKKKYADEKVAFVPKQSARNNFKGSPLFFNRSHYFVVAAAPGALQV